MHCFKLASNEKWKGSDHCSCDSHAVSLYRKPQGEMSWKAMLSFSMKILWCNHKAECDLDADWEMVCIAFCRMQLRGLFVRTVLPSPRVYSLVQVTAVMTLSHYLVSSYQYSHCKNGFPPVLVYGCIPGCSAAIFRARAWLLPPTGSSTAFTSLLHVGFPNFFTWLWRTGQSTSKYE